MDIKETVLRAGPEEIESPKELSFPDAMRSSIDSKELFQEGSLLLEDMHKKHGEELFFSLAGLASLWAAYGRCADGATRVYLQPHLVSLELFARGGEYLRDPSPDVRLALLRFTQQMLDSLFLLLYGRDAAISLIEEVWGERSQEVLAKVAGIQEDTARRWLRQDRIRLDTWSTRLFVESMHHMLQAGWTREEVASWWEGRICNMQLSERERIHSDLRSAGFEAWSWHT